jgi:DNA modification methylase
VIEINNIYQGDCRELLDKMHDKGIYVDAVITDPPYGLHFMSGENWDEKRIHSKANQGLVSSLPSGMKFDPKQGKNFYKFYLEVSEKLIKVMKPGAFFFSFGPPRLYHNMASAVEDAGFHIKDMWEWLYTQNQPKAQSMDHFIDLKDWDEETKNKIKEQLKGWKIPQVRSNHEPIVMAQKPLDGTYLNNQIVHGVGLVNTNIRVGDDKFVSNVVTTETDEIFSGHFLVSKPNKEERKDNPHKTVKPKTLMRHLISLVTMPGAVVLDPFVGSGTTAVAAKQIGRNYIGFDLNRENVEYSLRRLSK